MDFFTSLVSFLSPIGFRETIKTIYQDRKKRFKMCLSSGFLLLCLSLFPFSIYSIGSFISKGLQQPDLPWFSREHPPPPVFNYLLSYCCTFSPFSSWFDLAKQTRAALTWQYILAEGIPPGWTHPHLAQSPQSCLCLPHRAAGMWIKARIRETTAAPNGLAIYNSF